MVFEGDDKSISVIPKAEIIFEINPSVILSSCEDSFQSQVEDRIFIDSNGNDLLNTRWMNNTLNSFKSFDTFKTFHSSNSYKTFKSIQENNILIQVVETSLLLPHSTLFLEITKEGYLLKKNKTVLQTILFSSLEKSRVIEKNVLSQGKAVGTVELCFNQKAEKFFSDQIVFQIEFEEKSAIWDLFDFSPRLSSHKEFSYVFFKFPSIQLFFNFPPFNNFSISLTR